MIYLKNVKCVIALALSVICVIGVPWHQIYAGDEINEKTVIDDGNISEGSHEYTVKAGELHKVSFEPVANGVLEVSSSGNKVVYGYLYDGEGNVLASDEDTTDDFNFSISYDVKADAVYFVGFRFQNSGSEGSITVNVAFVERIEGWNYFEDGGRYYVRDGKILTGFQTIDGEIYCFDGEGRMYADSFVCFNDPDTGTSSSYHFDIDGHMTTEWYVSGASHYYYFEDGKAAKGLQTVDGVLYYFSNEGSMYCDTIIFDKESGTYIVVDENGAVTGNGEIIEGWNEIEGKMYYIENGSPVQFWKEINGTRYYFGTDGRMRAGEFVSIRIDHGSDLYYYDENGQYITGWFTYGDTMYYFESNGAGAKYLKRIDGKRYYFDHGRMLVDQIVYDYWTSRMYAIGTDGVILDIVFKNGWNHIGNDWYYLIGDHPAAGIYTINRKQYYFYYNGLMATNTTITNDLTGEVYVIGSDGVVIRKTGWYQDERNRWYYIDNNESVVGWKQVGDKWYYFDSWGFMLTGWRNFNFKWYYLGTSGAMATGWDKIDGTWYYFKDSGAMVTGWQKVGSTWYYFKDSGAMAANEWCDGYWLSADGSWTYQPKGSWKQDSKGWWFGDTSGWYAKNSTVKIDNVNYKFNASGYWVK